MADYISYLRCVAAITTILTTPIAAAFKLAVSYCVEVNHGQPVPISTTTSTTITVIGFLYFRLLLRGDCLVFKN
ncbi:hypothetical protein F5X99DRAFT_396682 [Biscogniauxia marginata]|nr:hypothetical protein F5X99DRAFT_396682 [Biscogniauxia marginata]